MLGGINFLGGKGKALNKDGYDFVIAGGGVVGLGIALALKERYPSQTIAIYEKEPELGVHASGRNSGVLHAGIYYPPNSLKARLCIEGKGLLKDYCREFDLPLLECGKVIVPRSGQDDPQLDTILATGRTLGVPLEEIGLDRLLAIEPAVSRRLKRAVYSPTTSVVNPKAVLLCMREQLTANGVQFFYGSPVADVGDGEILVAGKAVGYGHFINAAGAYADIIAHKMGVGMEYQLIPFRGLYHRLSRSSGIEVRGNIYPVPDLRVPFLGVHFTRSVDGDVYMGPTAIPALGRENYRGVEGMSFSDSFSILKCLASQYLQNKKGFRSLVHMEVPKVFLSKFYASAKQLVPDLEKHHLEKCTKVGIRAQLIHRSSLDLMMDFLVENGENSTHILNSVSPAFTSSMSFGKYVVDKYIS